MEISENRILVLCMTCNKPEFEKNENIIKNTWAKEIIDGKIKNMEFFFYTATDGKERIDYENNKIYVKSGDEIYDTFNKTRKCIKLIEKNNIQYDYIVRVNTSTFINTILLNNFISIMKQLNDNRILCTMIVKNAEDKYFPCGKVLVFNKEHIKYIMDYKFTNRKHLNDDEIYGKIFCDGKEPIEIFQYFKTPLDPMYFNWNDKFKYNYNFEKIDIEEIKRHIFYSVRSIYDNRDYECVTMLALYNALSNIKYNFDDVVDIYFNNIIGILDNKGIIDRYIRKDD